MDGEQLVKRILSEGHTLTRNEREKIRGPYDPIYLREKIRFHSRRVAFMRLVLLLVVGTLGFGLYLVLEHETLASTRPVSLWWLKALFTVLVVLCLFGLFSFTRNHAKNASLLRLVDFVQRQEAEQMGGVRGASEKLNEVVERPGEWRNPRGSAGREVKPIRESDME